jgi:SAM-dependent methyltransferase
MSSIYFFLQRLILFIHNGSVAIVQGLALGFLSGDQLERITAERYQRDSVSRGSYSDPGYLDSGLFLWERDTIQRHFPPGGRILIAAAGAGREMIALAGAGFQVDGFDCCAPLVEAGRSVLQERGIEATLEYAPPSAVPSCAPAYDAVLVGFSGYMYIPGRDRRIRFLKDLGRLLRPGSPLMVSFTEGYEGRRRVWTARIGTAARRLRRAGPVEEGDCLRDGFQHHFLREQIASEMDEAGFDLIHYSGGTCYGHGVGRARSAQNLSTSDAANTTK